jgi:hypothetical protein
MPCDFILERGLHKMTRTTNLKTIVLEKTLNLLFWKKKQAKEPNAIDVHPFFA